MATSKKSFAKNNTSAFKDTYQDVTDAVIKALAEGTVVWQCPWNQVGLPKNVTTGIEYRGWNIFWLNWHTIIKGYKTPFYITYKQAQELGGSIKMGEKGIKIIYWASIELKNQSTNTENQDSEEPNEKYPTRLVPKEHTVFNIDQAEGIQFPVVEALIKNEAAKIEACEEVIRNMPNKPGINIDGSSAYYIRSTDKVVVPNLKVHNSSEEFYCTLFHELAHSTGHESRLNRKELLDGGRENYSKEELTAELTAAFLCAVTGIQQKTIDNSAAYIKGWLSALKNDKTLILKAASQAQKAADYILNAKRVAQAA